VPTPLISEDIVALCLSGVSLLVGSRDAAMMPECARGVGLAFSADRREFTVYLPEASAGFTPRNLADNRRLALGVSVPLDHRSFQLKGEVLSCTRAGDEALPLIRRYLEQYADVLAVIGLPRDILVRVNHWPALAIVARLDELYVQTPGPGAGDALESRDEPSGERARSNRPEKGGAP
jgi:hypothetical protein